MGTNHLSSSDAIRQAKSLLGKRAAADAKRLLQDAITAAETELGSDAPELIELLCLFVESNRTERPWNVFPDDERKSLERALSLARTRHGDESPETMRVHEMLGVRLLAAKAFDEAAEHLALVARVKERIYGDGVIAAHALNGLADARLNLRQFADAHALYERSFEMAGGRGDDLMDFTINFGKARSLMGMGRHPEAVTVLEGAYDWFSKRFGKTSARELHAWLEAARKGLSDGVDDPT